MDSEIAIQALNVTKSFIIPHENINTLREKVIRFGRKNTYETFHALNNVSFEIKKGEFFGIIGRNGSGKSTLLKILAGIYTPDSGQVNINGAISPFLELGVGFNPELSGRDNIILNATILGMQKKEISKKFDEIVAFSELERFIDQKLKNYSSGMQVRLAFAVAINANKEILLMDEVIAVGDASFQVKCFENFEKIIKQGKTIIFVSHDSGSIQKFSNRVLYLESGSPLFIGSPSEALGLYMNSSIIREQAEKNESIVLTIDEKEKTPITNDAKEKLEENTLITERIEDNLRSIESYEVKFYDHHNKETSILENGKNIVIMVNYRVTIKLKDLIFGIIIRNSLNQEIFITNTFTKNILTGDINSGNLSVSYEFPNYFTAGKYSVSPAVCDKNQRIFYDWKDDYAHFYVQSSRGILSYHGIDLPHSIKLKHSK